MTTTRLPRAFPTSTARSEQARRTLAILALPLLAIAVWSGFWVAHVSAHGMGDSPDSAVYLGVANNIRAGHGPTSPFAALVDAYGPNQIVKFNGRVPVTHYPPGYPIALAALSLFTGGVDAASRVMGILLAPINLVLLALLTARMTGYRSWIVPLIPPLLVIFIQDTVFFALSAQGWLPGHATVWSEGLFTAFTTAMLLVFPSCLADDRRARRAFVGVTALAAGALFTRYVGLADVAAGALALVVLDRSRVLRRRLVRAGVFAAAAGAPLAVFLFWSRLIGGGSARLLAYHPLSAFRGRMLRAFSQTLFDGLGSTFVREVMLLAVLVAVGVFLVRLPRRSAATWRGDDAASQAIVGVLLLLVAYVAVVWISRTFYDTALQIDARLLIPARGLLYALVVAVAFRVLSGYMRQLVAGLVVVAFAAVPAIHNWPQQHKVLRYYRPLHLSGGAIDRRVSRLPKGTLIVSTTPETVYIASRRAAVVIPQPRVYGTGEKNRNYRAQMRELVTMLHRRGGYILTFASDRSLLTPLFSENISPRIVAKDTHETLYRVLPTGSSST